ncbi:MAG: putative quinol monooxygenase [Acidimicrobiales bacterium]
MSDTVIVTGVFDLDPSRRERAIAVFTEMMERTRAEEGCEHYAFSADLTDPGRFHLIEQWSSLTLNEAHVQTPHFPTFLDQLGGLGITAVTITQWLGATGKRVR